MMDRKALIRAYREHRPTMGVYCIRRRDTGRAFVGASVNVPAIFNRERLQLRFGAHGIASLQRDWNALGEEAFEFVLLDELDWPEGTPDYRPTDDLAALLAMWKERLALTPENTYAPLARRGVAT
ncbi:MAG: GIY-YIG nuclease family protein [Gemmatimonadaceae bacterium]|nr:GIY-YIG nuclease family protein [Gemmatimonadaceae bacterium]